MKKLLLPLAGALLIISGLSGCQSTELVSGLPTPSVVTESTAADSSGDLEQLPKIAKLTGRSSQLNNQ